jgi:hypothetical protein
VPRALRRHDRKTTRLLQPTRERLLPETRFPRQLPRADRIAAGQTGDHLLSKCWRKGLRHAVVAFSPLEVGIKCWVNSIRRRSTICDWREHGCALVQDVVE